MKKNIAKESQRLSVEEVWRGLTQKIRHDLMEYQKISNASELGKVLENLRSQGIADVSQLLINVDRDKQVKVVNFNHEDGKTEQCGSLDNIHLKGSTDPFLMIKLEERHKASFSFLYSKDKVINKIMRVEDDAGNILYENEGGDDV
jgi:hypothetical protein